MDDGGLHRSGVKITRVRVDRVLLLYHGVRPLHALPARGLIPVRIGLVFKNGPVRYANKYNNVHYGRCATQSKPVSPASRHRDAKSRDVGNDYINYIDCHGTIPIPFNVQNAPE